MATQMAALDDFVTRARQQNESSFESHTTHIRDLSRQVGGSLAEIQASLSDEAVQLFNADVQNETASLSNSLKPLAEEVHQPIQTLASYFTTSSLHNYSPTGETPAKKIWTYPTDLPRTVTGHTPPPKTTPSTPGPAAKTPGRTRSKSKSPKKMASPRKMLVKEVYVDTPPHIQTITTTIPLAPPATISRTESTRSLPATTGLKELDINTMPNHNQTISFPIMSDTPSTTSKSRSTREKDENPSKTKVPQLRATRSTKSKTQNMLSMSVGPGSGGPPMTDTGTKEKENVPHAIEGKHIPRPATAIGYSGRRLRSSPPQSQS